LTIGIGIAIYNEVIRKHTGEEPDMHEVVCHLIESIEAHSTCPFHLIIRDNDSLDFRFRNFEVTLGKRFPHLSWEFYVDSEKSLTKAWNDAIHRSLNRGCKAIVLANQDVIVTKYWQNFLNAIQTPSRDLIAPLMTEACYQPAQMVSDKEFDPDDSLWHVPVIQGCCFGGSANAFEKNMYDTTNFFDPGFEFGYNEIEWQIRNNQTGGRSLLAMNSFVLHLEEYSWAGLDSSKKIARDFRGEERSEILDVIDYYSYIGVTNDT